MSKQDTASNTTNTTSNTATGTKAKSPFEFPFAMPAMPAMPEAFGQLMRDQIVRTQQVMGELANYEGVAIARARTAVDELARLASDSINYWGQLSAEWRKLSVEAVQRTADAFAPKA